jgi:hypothetical protein
VKLQSSQNQSPTQFFLLGVTATALVLALIILSPVRRFGASIFGDVLGLRQDSAGLFEGRSTPWGKLEVTELPLPTPEGFFPGRAERLQKTSWFFQNFTESELARFLLSCDLTAIQRQVLLDKRCWRIESNGCVVTPPEALVWYLKSSSRRKIYSILGQSPVNVPQCYAFSFPAGTFADFLERNGVIPRNVNKISRLAYTVSSVTYFADLQAVRAVLTSVEFEKLAGALHATPAVALRLCVTPSSDVRTLIKYWGRGGRENAIKPLLTALSRAPGGTSIDISCLLPPFARDRLYTYPVSWNDPAITREDCFFTAMNFFHETPDTNFFNSDYIQTILCNDFVRVTGRPAYGDLVGVLNPTKGIVHMCVYIAKDFVFTKNGADRAQPWVLMRMDNMLRAYRSSQDPAQVIFFRRQTAA